MGSTPAAYLTLSIDDGHPADLRTADLLEEFGLAATFYVPAANSEREVLGEPEVRALAERFEVGAHTYHHVTLPRLPAEEARREIVDGKAWLEDVVGKPVVAFCYPGGKFNARVAGLVAEAGFAGARTCAQNVLESPGNPFFWGISTQAFSHPRRIQIRHAAREGNWSGLANFVRVFRGAVDWEVHFDRAVSHVAEHGGVAHLYLHSWEIDEQGDWPKLRRVLQRLHGRDDLTTVTNGELFTMG